MMSTGDINFLVEMVAEEVDSLDALQHQNQSLLLELAEDLKCYLTLLSNFLEQQAAFVLNQKIDAQWASSCP